ncbi:DUF3029 family protein, partial [Escherichia coli]|nr:DUF3029 family protein [Escherichia coli]
KSNFFQGFLTQEGLIKESYFAPMYGVYGMAEAVNLLFEKEGQIGRYGKNDRANTFAHDVSATLAKLVDSTPVKYGLDGKALLHAQGGISL